MIRRKIKVKPLTSYSHTQGDRYDGAQAIRCVGQDRKPR